jgi:hypothetical protein
MVAAQQTRRLGRFGLFVLDRLRLVENHVVEDLVFKVQSIAAQRSVCGQNHIVAGELVLIARTAGVVEHAQLRREPLDLLLPIEDERFGNHNQRGLIELRLRA